MATSLTDRRSGISGSLAIKQPCRVATTAAITLSGLQTIDGVAVVADDRVLVKDQSNAVENGIYIASTSEWERAKDFDGPLDVVKGTFVLVIEGIAGGGKEYQVTTADDITVGTSPITWALRQVYQDLEDAVDAAEAAQAGAEAAQAGAEAVLADCLKKNENLADLPDKPLARTNLGLGTAAVATLGTGSGQVPTADDIPGLTPLLIGYGAGIRLSNNTSDATNDIDFSAGTVRDDSSTVDLTLVATNVKQLDVEFAEYSAIGTPSGGRAAADDLTGAKWFYCWIIGGAGKDTQGFFSTSSNPTLPSGFTWKAYRGRIYWNGSAIKAFRQVGRNRFDWVAESGDWDVTNPGTSTVIRTVTAPPNTVARICIGIINGTTNSNLYRVWETWKADGAPTQTTADLSSQSDAQIAFMYSEKEVGVDAASQVRTRVTASNVADRIIGRTMGFIDPEL